MASSTLNHEGFSILHMSLLSERLARVYADLPDLEGERGQIGLVKASGASKSVVNQWLNGKIKSLDILYALAMEKNLGYSHIWLMAGIGEPMVKPAAQDATEVVRVSSALLARYWALDAPSQRDVDAYIKLVEQRAAVAVTPIESSGPAGAAKKVSTASKAVFEIDPIEEDSDQSGWRAPEK